jgi:hypothetical protein
MNPICNYCKKTILPFEEWQYVSGELVHMDCEPDPEQDEFVISGQSSADK